MDFGVLNDAQIQFSSSDSTGTEMCHDVTIVGDDIKENTEFFQVMLTPVAAQDNVEGSNRITISITDDVDSKFRDR